MPLIKLLTLSFVVSISFCLSNASHADLVVNGDMSTNAYGAANGVNHLEFGALDGGWVVKSQTNLDFDTNVGLITWNGPSTNLIADALAQVNSVSTQTGSLMNLSFEWTAALGSSTPDIEYQVIGWKNTGAAPASGIFFNNINSESRNVSGLEGATEHVDFLDALGASNGSAATAAASIGTFAGTAGAMASASIDIDISGHGAGYSGLSDYDYIGVRFWIADDNSDLTAIGSMLDNVSLVSTAVPEPGSLAALHICCLGMLLRRKRFA